MTNYQELTGKFNKIISEIDESLIKVNVNIEDRPLIAVTIIMNYYITETKNITEETLLKLLFMTSIKWYNNNYGKSLSKQDDLFTYGLTEINGVFLKIRAPKSPTNINNKTGNLHLSFTPYVNKDENIIEWIENPPNFRIIDNNKMLSMRQNIIHTIELLRKIYINVMFSNTEDPDVEALLKGILPSLEDAAHKFFRGSYGEAFWELQMATERSLKALSQQKTSTYKQTHDIEKLYDRIRHYLCNSELEISDKIIGHRKNIEMRYGYYEKYSVRDTVDSYKEYLIFISTLLSNTEKFIDISDFSVELRSFHGDVEISRL